jgi:4-hydroxymandelate oxidase
MEDVAEAFVGSTAPLLLQLYPLRDHDLMTTIVDRARTAGFHGLMVTVDAPVSGRRETDMRHGFALDSQVHLPHLDGVGLASRSPLLRFETMKDAAMTWEGLAWLRQQTDLPIWLKGVLRKEDVVHAAEEGYDGVVISNHGGRQLDVATAPLEALRGARRALDTAGHRMALLVDGGVRRGSDVLKALGLGADAVMIGRPAVWGLAVNGQGGVAQVLNLLDQELTTTMRLAGCARLEHITPDLLTQVVGVPHLVDTSPS